MAGTIPSRQKVAISRTLSMLFIFSTASSRRFCASLACASSSPVSFSRRSCTPVPASGQALRTLQMESASRAV